MIKTSDILDESTKADLQENKSDRGNQLRNQEEQKAMGELYDNTPPFLNINITLTFNLSLIITFFHFVGLMYLCIFS